MYEIHYNFQNSKHKPNVNYSLSFYALQNYTANTIMQAIPYREALDKQQIDSKSNTSKQVVVAKKRVCAAGENVKS